MEVRKHQLIRLAAWLLIAVSCIYLVRSTLQFVRLIIPSPQAITIQAHDATGEITLDKTILGFTGDCTQVTWQVENIHAIYFTGYGTVGVGERAVCSEHDYFTIDFRDGTTQTYPLHIEYAGHAFVRWLLVTIVIGAAGLWLVRPQTRQKVVNVIWGARASFWQPLIYIAAGIIMIIAGYLMGHAAYNGRVYHYHDSASYLELTEQLKREGLFDFNNRSFNHLYVYPAFMAVCQQIIFVVLGPAYTQEPFVLIQYLLFVTLPALLAAGIVRRLNSDYAAAPRLQLVIFALVQLNPMLISASREVFVETLNILVVTLFAYALITPFRARLLVLSTMAALLIADKPILYVYWLAFFCLIVVIYALVFGLVHRRLADWWQRLKTSLHRLTPAVVILSLVQIIVPVFILVGLQMRHVWNVEERVALYPSPLSNTFLDSTVGILSIDLIKYETYHPYEPGDREIGGIAYIDHERTARYLRFLEAENGEPTITNAIRFMLQTPLETLYTLFIRSMSSFQMYEWPFFRQELYVAPTYIFWWGFGAILCLAYSTVFFIESGLGVRLPAAKKMRLFSWVLIYLIIITFIPPSVLIVSESRRIWPILPLLTVAGVYLIWQQQRWLKLAVVAVISLAFYWHVLTVLQVALAYALNQ